MILYCANCGDALLFNPSLGKMECLSCGALFDANEASTEYTENDTATNPTTERLCKPDVSSKETTDKLVTPNTEGETMECNIYSCTACGAELMINGVESSTFCAYCGQPTIVFNRVSSEAKPKYIIPFSITKEQAVAAIRNRFKKGLVIPNEIKHFDIERVRGIYIPFWLYDIHYHDSQYLKGTVGSGKSKRTKYFFREAECNFKRLTLDSSKQLSDESSQRLEPYDTFAVQPFDIGYLSGFYADRYDMSKKNTESLALSRAKLLFDNQVKSTVRASNVQIIKCNPKRTIKNVDYALFPAWFLTFRYKDQPHTILVNGQTGKVVGAVPFHKGKVTGIYLAISAGLSFISSLFAISYLSGDPEEPGKMIALMIMLSVFCFITGKAIFGKIKKNIGLTTAKDMNRFVKNRQEGI